MFANVSFAAKPINLPGNLEYVLSSKVLGGLALQFILFLTGFACFDHRIIYLVARFFSNREVFETRGRRCVSLKYEARNHQIKWGQHASIM